MAVRFRDEDTGRFISYDDYQERGGAIVWIDYQHEATQEEEEEGEEEEVLEGQWEGGDWDGDYESFDFGDEDIYP